MKLRTLVLLFGLFILMINFFKCSEKEKDNQPPICHVEFPIQNDTLFYGEDYLFAADALDSDGAINYIKLYFDGELLSQISDPAIAFLFITELFPIGEHIVEFKVGDNIGETVSESVEIYIKSNVPYVTTAEVFNVGGTTATVSGIVLKDAGLSITSRGICYSTTANPVVTDNKVECGSGIGGFFADLKDLEMGTTYYVRAYAENPNGAGYGAELTFTTLGPPTVITCDTTEITENSAKLKGEVISENGSQVHYRGITWSSYSEHPDPNYNSYVDLGEGIGEMQTVLDNLDMSTKYYYRAFAINDYDISFGESKSFTTSTPPFSFDDIYPVSITEDKAKIAVVFHSFGTVNLTNKGLCWNTSGNPSTSDNIVELGAGNESYQIIVENLSPNTTYYFKGFAMSSNKIAYYTSEQEITTLTGNVNSQVITDYRNGNKYLTVEIGDKRWFAENLNYSYGIDDCYLFDDKYCLVYGKYYDEPYANLCPSGWHIPSDDEWGELEMFLGMSQSQVNSWGWRGNNEGGKMKSMVSWDLPNTGATNSSGLNIIAGGQLWIYPPDNDYWFAEQGKAAFFFTSDWDNNGIYRSFSYSKKQVERASYSFGYEDYLYQKSVRCIKN